MGNTKNFNFPMRCLKEEILKDDGFDVSEALNDVYRKENKKEWARKIGVYHPSSLRGCKRVLYYDRVSQAPVNDIHPNLMMLFDLGHAIHEKVQSRLINTLYAASIEEEASSVCSELSMAGSCDLIVRDPDWIIEIKTIGDVSFKTLVKPKTDHVWQVHCYMFMNDIPRAQIFYVNRNSGRRRVFRIRFSNKIWDQIIETINFVEEYVEKGIEPPREICSYLCRSCKFKYKCEPEI